MTGPEGTARPMGKHQIAIRDLDLGMRFTPGLAHRLDDRVGHAGLRRHLGGDPPRGDKDPARQVDPPQQRLPGDPVHRVVPPDVLRMKQDRPPVAHRGHGLGVLGAQKINVAAKAVQQKVDATVDTDGLKAAVERNADRPCATNASTGFSTTFAQHLDRTSRLIGGLRSLGVGRGDRFAVMTLNSPEYLELYHAAYLGGGVVNPLNLRFAAKELAYVLRDSDTKVCFVDAWFAPLIDSVKAEAGLEHVVLVGGGADTAPHTVTYDDLIASSTPTNSGKSTTHR